MSRRVAIASDAALEIDRIDEWWRLNRPKNPLLFTTEFRRAMRTIESLPSAGRSVKGTSLSGVRRLLMPKTRYFLYYRYSEAEAQILAIWSGLYEDLPEI